MKNKFILLLALLLLNGAVITTSIVKVKTGDYLITNTHPIEGYSDKISYYNGDKVELKIHCRESLYSLDVSRYGQTREPLISEKNLPGRKQDYTPDSSENGLNWETTYSFPIPDSWRNGLYSAKVSDSSGNTSYITFIVKGDSKNLKGSIAILASTNTWEAYNDWGGLSFYSKASDSQSGDDDESPASRTGIVSMMRPNPQGDPTKGSGHTAGAELHVLSWLESQGHHYKLLADYDLDKEPAVLDNFKVLIISTHNEYWTKNMYDSLERFLNRGGSLLYLSGNGVYWKAVIKEKQLEVRKDFKNHRLDNSPGGYWTHNLKRTESSILGVRFQNSDFSVPAPYKVMKADHWIFKDTGLKNGDLIGKTGLTTVRGSTGGASGWETDQMDKNSPPNCVLLARGMNTKGKGADMVYYDHPAGGGVFSAGSITFGGSLAVDQNLTKMVNNVLDHFLAEQEPKAGK